MIKFNFFFKLPSVTSSKVGFDRIGTNCVTLLFEYLSLALEFGLPGDHGIEELDLGEEQSLRLQLQRHSVTHVVDELFQTQEFHAAQRTPVAPVDVDLHLRQFPI